MSDNLPSPHFARREQGEEPAAVPMLRLFSQAWSGAYRVEGEIDAADCLIAFSFGGIRRHRRKIQPGCSNADLARYVRENFPCLPKILQGEIADAYGAEALTSRVWRIDRHRRPGKYLDTYEVAVQARRIMQQQSWETAVVLAQAHHLPRATAVCRKLGVHTVVPAGLERVPFCPNSFQKWTRNRLRWFRREVGAIFYYRFWKKCI
jgi:hypothetical protein